MEDRPRNQVAYAIACVVVHQRAHQLVARHSPVPVGEMLFAIGFTSEAREGLEPRAHSYAAGPEW